MLVDLLAAIFLTLGGVFCFIAGLGIVRLGDIYIRMHASTKAGTLGIALIAVAMMLHARSVLEVLEPLFVFLFMILTIPIGSHLIGRAAFRTRIGMQEGTRFDAGCEVFRRVHPGARPAAGAKAGAREAAGDRPTATPMAGEPGV
jgi:multicomponent Na+:H+ antiporter subunit G